jgi:dihydrofolate reductase
MVKKVPMEKIVLIAVIGSNKAFKEDGCPIHILNQTYNGFFRDLTDNGIMVMSQDTYEQLPDKSPPFACRPSYVVTDQECTVTEGCNVKIVASLAKLFEQTADDNRSMFILIKNPLYKELFDSYKEKIDLVIVAEINEAMTGETFNSLAVFEWQPLLLLEEKTGGTRSPGFIIHQYKPDPFEL